MAEPRKSKPRLTLRDLASVEVPTASVADVLGGMTDDGAPDAAEAAAVTRSASISAESPVVPGGEGLAADEAGTTAEAAADEAAPAKASTAKASPAKSAPVSTRQLEALPEGVSPEVAAMLGLPEASSLIEPEPEPEPAVPVTVAEPTPVAEPESKSSRGGLFGALLLVGAAAAAAIWFGTRPPVLDGALFETSPVSATAPSTVPDVLVAFLPVPEPVVVEPTPVVAPTPRSSRPSRSPRTEVREEDLF